MVLMLTKTVEGTKVCAHTHMPCINLPIGNLHDLQRKSEDYYPESPGATFSVGRFQIRTISLKYHVDYEVRVFEVSQVRKILHCVCGSRCCYLATHSHCPNHI